MIEEVKDLMEDVKDKVGDKGFSVIVVCLVAVGAYLVYRSFKGSGSENVPYTPTGVTGYPTIGDNADVVMESVNNAIENSYNDMSSLMDSRLEYIEGILGDIQTEADTNTNEIINNSNQNTDYIVNNSNQNTNTIVQNSNQNKQEVKQVIEEVKQVASKVENVENVTQTYTPPTPTTPPKVTNTAPKTTPKNTYTYTQKAGLNTSTSIVDALKATGADSSFSARKKIAEANGISNYTGSYSQNVALLNKMKNGTLNKA